MIWRLLDKLFFAAVLVLALQVPLLADHYHQFLSGLHESTEWQVDGYKATAKQHGYPGIKSMIDHHLQNQVPSVRADAGQKQVTLERYQALRVAMETFEHGSLIEKTLYMFGPSGHDYLAGTIANFKPGLPLTIGGLGFGVIVGVAVHFIVTLPLFLWSKRRIPGRWSNEEASTQRPS